MNSVELIVELRRRPQFKAFIEQIELTIGKVVNLYITRIGNRDVSSVASKAIKDAVWGMIDVTDRELLVLDSPILQRLRYIRQLGLTFLTYPTASYSRFEHTIGAMHQSERMLKAIAMRSPDSGALQKYVHTVRLAALLHDTGHLPLSHASEKYFSEDECQQPDLYNELRALREEIATFLKVRTPRLSECLSLGISLSESFYSLLRRVNYSQEEIADSVLCLVGRAPSLNAAFLAQLISNVIDADKLDYMFRDGMATGVPLAVDLERLLYKLKCIDVPIADCPEGLRQIELQNELTAKILATDLAGQQHARDLTISRAMLYDRVYYHHKTLAAERVLMKLLGSLGKHPTQLIAEDDRLFSPYSLGRLPSEAKPLVRMLHERDLPKRVFAMSYKFLMPFARKSKDGRLVIPDPLRDSFDRFQTVLHEPSSRLELESRIIQRFKILSEHLGYPLDEVKIWVDIPPEPFEVPDAELIVARPDGSLSPIENFPDEAAAFAYSPSKTAYVYASGVNLNREICFLAVEIEFAERFKFHFGRGAADYAKINWLKVEELKFKLEDNNVDFFEPFRVIKPYPKSIASQKSRDRIKVLADKFGHYGVSSKIRINAERITDFLRQFPGQVAGSMLTLLEKLHFIGPSELGAEFGDTLQKNCDANAIFVPLSQELAESASHIGYFLAKSSSVLERRISPFLTKALTSDQPIVFFEDCLLSGTQACSVVQTWFNLPKDVDEKLTDPLNEQQADLLRQRSLEFHFILGTLHGQAKLEALFQQVRLKGKICIHRKIDPSKKLIDFELSRQEALQLRGYLQKVGEQLLITSKATQDATKWTSLRCKEFALGYGGMELWVAFHYNVPTATVTALWKSGDYAGTAWLPLFPSAAEIDLLEAGV